jgi:hypothetical protein
MAFGDDLNKLLPNYLVEDDKSRLKNALEQFQNQGQRELNYSGFSKNYNHPFFLQSDLVREIRMPLWDDDSATYEKVYTDAIILSNTCDLSTDNKHSSNVKECLFAPLVDLSEFLHDIERSGTKKDSLDQFSRAIKNQLVSNLFYIPNCTVEDKEYIALLDNVFWFPTAELNAYIDSINVNRISSLSLFGHYLFILKLSYHMCRLPEESDRAV